MSRGAAAAGQAPTHLRSSDPTSAAHAGTVKLSSVSTAITPCPFGSSSTSADATETASSGTTAACAVSAVYPKVWYTETTPSEAAHAPTTKAPVPAYDFVSEKGHLTFPNLRRRVGGERAQSGYGRVGGGGRWRRRRAPAANNVGDAVAYGHLADGDGGDDRAEAEERRGEEHPRVPAASEIASEQ